MRMKRKAVFFDKDGTLVEDIPYNSDPERMELEPGVGPALAQLHAAGFLLVIVTNQSGVARGYFSESALEPVARRMRRLFVDASAELAGFYYCPHHPEGTVPAYAVECTCRKPQPGLILMAARELQVDLTLSWMVGDILNDVEAGKRAGCRTILVDNGNETEWIRSPLREPEVVVGSVLEAAREILREVAVVPRSFSGVMGGWNDE